MLTSKLIIKLTIFIGSYLIFPLLYIAWVKRFYLMLFLSVVFIYARFIEPSFVWVNHYKIETGFEAKYALIADIHLGIYNDESILEKVVEKVNEQDIEALLIAGDFTYEPNISNLKKLFAPLKEVKVPIYAVMGNHDMQRPGPKLDRELKEVLEELGINVIDNQVVKLQNVTLLGLGSHWAGDDEVSLLDGITHEENLVVLTHNPDTTLDYAKTHSADLTLAGHTHGGQVRLPWIYQDMIPVSGEVPWDQGLYAYKNHQVFVTSGIGMIGLPFRFLIPPTVDVLELY
ncbi:MAG: metallophosphoesterase [Sulfurovaceae bacterium]|nr:metallophosphoesterase [Sulfurovaceae bacterium]